MPLQKQVSQDQVQYIKTTRNKQMQQQDDEIQITKTTYSPVNKLQQASCSIPVPPDNHCALHTLYLILYTFKDLKMKPRDFIKTIRKALCEKYTTNSKYTDPNEWLSITDLNTIAEELYNIQLQDVKHLSTIKKKSHRKEWYYYDFKNENHFDLVIPLEEWDKLTKTKKTFLKSYVTNKENHIKLTKKDFSCEKIKKK